MGRNATSGHQPLSASEIGLLKTLQDECLRVRATLEDKSNRNFTSLKHWVETRAIPTFNNRFHVADSEEGDKIYQWYKNHCKVSTSSLPVHHVPPAQDLHEASSLRKLPSLRTLVYRDFSEEICKAARHAASDFLSPDRYICEWNKVLSTKVDSLSAEERQRYETIIAAETVKQESNPSKDDILASQHMLRGEITTAIQNVLGWERKQYGDAMCFLTITYRNRYDEVIEDRFMVSNEEWFLTHYKPFIAQYDKYMGGMFASIGELTLPKHNVNTLPKASFIKKLTNGTQVFQPPSPEMLTPIELCQLLKTFIEELWVSSDTDRSPDTLPWDMLQQTEPPMESPLQDSSILSSFSSLNPEELESGDLFKLAAVLSDTEHGVVFKKSTLQISPNRSTPPLPQPSPPPMSPVHVSPGPPLPPHYQLPPSTPPHTPPRTPSCVPPPEQSDPSPQRQSSADKPSPPVSGTVGDLSMTQKHLEPALQPISAPSQPSDPPVPAQPEPSPLPLPPTQDEVPLVLTDKKQKKGKKQKNQPQIARPSHSRVSKPPMTAEPQGNTMGRRTRVCDRYTYEQINSSPPAEPVDQTEDVPSPGTQGRRPHKRLRRR